MADIFKDVGTIVFTAVVIGNFVPGFKEEINVARVAWGLGIVVVFWFVSYLCRPEGGNSG